MSTRGSVPAVSFSTAALHGLAPDGGLYVPERLPRLDETALDRLLPLVGEYPRFAEAVLAPFLRDDPLAASLPELAADAFDFPVRLDTWDARTAILELFHGPTSAFKDFGARFLAACFQRRIESEDGAALAIVVATSGDTGAAVAAACHGRPGMTVAVLYPAGGVSPRQEHQLSCWGDNVTTLSVRGTFDDCQRLAKEAFSSGGFEEFGRLTSANSINVGRLLPQVVYYAWASLVYQAAHGEGAAFVVPSGNMGNAMGAVWARAMGFPIRRIALAANANRVVPDWLATGRWQPRPSVGTIANAMDVGAPSNMERLFHHLGLDAETGAGAPTTEDPESFLAAASVEDEQIRATIRWASRFRDERHAGRIVCPHTAAALHMRRELDDSGWIVVATAHPAKFDSIVEPLVGHTVDAPPALAALLRRPRTFETIDATLAAFRDAWVDGRER